METHQRIAELMHSRVAEDRLILFEVGPGQFGGVVVVTFDGEAKKLELTGSSSDVLDRFAENMAARLATENLGAGVAANLAATLGALTGTEAPIWLRDGSLNERAFQPTR